MVLCLLQKNSLIIRLSLFPAETGIWLAVSTALPVVNYFQRPVSAVDIIACYGLDVIEAVVPAVKLPPEVVSYQHNIELSNSFEIFPLQYEESSEGI